MDVRILNSADFMEEMRTMRDDTHFFLHHAFAIAQLKHEKYFLISLASFMFH